MDTQTKPEPAAKPPPINYNNDFKARLKAKKATGEQPEFAVVVYEHPSYRGHYGQ